MMIVYALGVIGAISSFGFGCLSLYRSDPDTAAAWFALFGVYVLHATKEDRA